jgi:tetratricopeptide (TPR) repeat protein
LLSGSSQAVLPRHKTLLASIEWSYHLLMQKEQLLLQRLAIFSGSWDLEAAEDICSGEGIDRDEVLDLLEGLVDHSMVIADTRTERQARYHLLETVRQYAHAILIESKDLERIDQRHLLYYLRLAEQADQELRGPRQRTWLKRLEQERSNFTSALERSLSTPSNALEGVRLACALTWYWGMIWNFTQARYYLQMVLPHIADFPKSSLKATILFQVASASAWGMNLLEPQAMVAYLEESLAIWQAQPADTALQEAQCLLTKGWVMTSNNIGDQGLALMCKCCETFQQIGDNWWQAWATNLISMSREEQGDDAQAVRAILLKETMLWRKAGDRLSEVIPILDWGQYTLKHGDFVEAQTSLLRSLAIFEEFEAKGFMTQITRDLGQAARALQEFDQAEYYYQKCEQLIQASGDSMLLYYVHCGRGFTALHRGDDRQAEQFFKKAFEIILQSKRRLIFWIAGFAALHTIRNQPEAAAQLFGAFFALKDAYQVSVQPADQIEIDYFLPLCQANLDKTAFDRAWEIGQTMMMEQVAASVLVSGF